MSQYPNGISKKAHTGWFIFSSNADVRPDSRIVVPFKPPLPPPEKEGEKFDYAKFITVTSSSLMALLAIFIIMHNLK